MDLQKNTNMPERGEPLGLALIIQKSNVLQGYCIVATYLSQKEAIQWKVLVNIEWHMFLMEIIFTENWRGRNIYLYLVNCAGYFLLIISDPLPILLFALGD